MPRLNCARAVGAVALAMLAWTPVQAADEDAARALPNEPAAAPKVVPAGFDAPGVRTLGREGLAAYRGGTEVLNDMKLRGVVSDNQAINVTTGTNLISDGAFSGAAGMPMVIQNSGNNVLIQSATIVNVQLK
jgi:hypothetical protein